MRGKFWYAWSKWSRKSTIFNLITGLIKPRNGKIKIAGENAMQYPIY